MEDGDGAGDGGGDGAGSGAPGRSQRRQRKKSRKAREAAGEDDSSGEKESASSRPRRRSVDEANGDPDGQQRHGSQSSETGSGDSASSKSSYDTDDTDESEERARLKRQRDRKKRAAAAARKRPRQRPLQVAKDKGKKKSRRSASEALVKEANNQFSGSDEHSSGEDVSARPKPSKFASSADSSASWPGDIALVAHPPGPGHPRDTPRRGHGEFHRVTNDEVADREAPPAYRSSEPLLLPVGCLRERKQSIERLVTMLYRRNWVCDQKAFVLQAKDSAAKNGLTNSVISDMARTYGVYIKQALFTLPVPARQRLWSLLDNLRQHLMARLIRDDILEAGTNLDDANNPSLRQTNCILLCDVDVRVALGQLTNELWLSWWDDNSTATQMTYHREDARPAVSCGIIK